MKVLKPIVITAATIAALLIVAAIIAPGIAKNYIIKHSKELIGRQINIDKLYANVFTGSCRITGFELLDTNDTDRFVTFDTLSVDISIFRLLSDELRVNHITLVNPNINIWQKGSTFNFDDLLQLSAGDKQEQPDTAKSSESMAIALYNINIRRGQVIYRDLAINSLWDINDIQLAIPGVYFSGKNTDIGAELRFSEGGSLRTSLQYGMDAGNYSVLLQLKDFSIANTLPYLKEYLNVNSVNGTLTADTQIEGNINHVADVTVKGTVSLNNFNLTDADNKNVLSNDELFIDIENINPEKQQFDFNAITIKGLKSFFDLYPKTNNFSQLIKTTESTASAAPATIETGDTVTPRLSVGKFSVENTAFTFNDHTLREAFTFTLGDIQMNADNFTLSGHNKVSVSNTFLNGGSIKLNWDGYLNDMGNQNITLIIKNLDLKTFTPYSLEYFGYPLKNGVLSFNSINNIRRNHLDGRNSLDIYRCEVDKKRKDLKVEYNIPLRTALYIIKDVNDKIKMDLPVSGDINSPAFSYKKIIIKTLMNLLVKVAVSPFNFMANSLGLSPDKLKEIPFEVYQNDFTPEQFSRINEIASVVKSKPEMTLVLKQYFNRQQGIESLAMFNAKKNYYLHTHPEQSDSTLQAIDFARIIELSPADTAFSSYITTLVPAEIKTAPIRQKVLSLKPEEQLKQQVNHLADLRNRQLTNYLLRQGLTDKNISISTVSGDTLTSYKGNNIYTVKMILEGDGELPEELIPAENNSQANNL